MSDLFGDAYAGTYLAIAQTTDAFIARVYPECDRQSEYREMESWLSHCAPSKRPKNVRRFVLTWMKRAKRFEQLNGDAVRAEANVGKGPLES